MCESHILSKTSEKSSKRPVKYRRFVDPFLSSNSCIKKSFQHKPWVENINSWAKSIGPIPEHPRSLGILDDGNI